MVIFLNLDWLLGFIEAKGSFNVPIQSGYTPRPKFTIDSNIKYEVMFKEGAFVGKQLGNKSTAGLSHWIDRIEVVGNIHENKG